MPLVSKQSIISTVGKYIYNFAEKEKKEQPF
jgi:hypothetical protein